MNKTEFTKVVAAKCDLSQANAGSFIDGFFQALAEQLRLGETVELVGLGNFKVTERAARQGRNPRTGEPLQIAASKNVKFMPGKLLKDSAMASPIKSNLKK